MVSHNISVRYSGIETAKSHIRLLHLLNLTNKHNRRLNIKETTLSTMNPTTTAQRPFLPEPLQELQLRQLHFYLWLYGLSVAAVLLEVTAGITEAGARTIAEGDVLIHIVGQGRE